MHFETARFQWYRQTLAALERAAEGKTPAERAYLMDLRRTGFEMFQEDEKRERLAAQQRVLLRQIASDTWELGDERAPLRLRYPAIGLRAAAAAIAAQQGQSDAPLASAFSASAAPDVVLRAAIGRARRWADLHCPPLARALRCTRVTGRPARLRYEPEAGAPEFVLRLQDSPNAASADTIAASPLRSS